MCDASAHVAGVGALKRVLRDVETGQFLKKTQGEGQGHELVVLDVEVGQARQSADFTRQLSDFVVFELEGAAGVHEESVKQSRAELRRGRRRAHMCMAAGETVAMKLLLRLTA